MKKLLSLFVVLGVMLMLASGSALAQRHDGGRGHDRGYDRQHQYDQSRGKGHYKGHGKNKNRGNAYGHYKYKNWHDRGRHEGWYKRGGYLPREYRGRQYVVTDWRYNRLREPPRGYHWVRSDTGDFLLVAITTGVILDLLLNH